jgi:hypothetical protein
MRNNGDERENYENGFENDINRKEHVKNDIEMKALHV